MTRKAIAAPAATYQKNAPASPAADSDWMISGAVPPNSATVRLYQAPMPSPRSSVGNSSLMIAGAMDVIAVYSPSPTQNTTSRLPRPGPISVDSGTTSTAVAADQTR